VDTRVRQFTNLQKKDAMPKNFPKNPFDKDTARTEVTFDSSSFFDFLSRVLFYDAKPWVSQFLELARCYPPQPEVGTHADLEPLGDTGDSSSAAAAARKKDKAPKRKQPEESVESEEGTLSASSSSLSETEKRTKMKQDVGIPAVPLASAPPLLKGVRATDFAIGDS
jgi:hypothetical protein